MPDGRSEHDRITDLAVQLDCYARVTNGELRNLREGQQRLIEGQDALLRRQDRFEVRQDRFEERQDRFEQRMDRFQGELVELREGQKRIVDVMNENFRQLFVLLNERRP